MESDGAFVEYFVEQGFPSLFALVAVVAGAYAALWLVTARLARRRLPPGLAVAAAVGACAALAVFAIGVTLFEALALYYRQLPPGYGTQRQGAELERFYTAAELGFAALYAVVMFVGGTTAAVVARRRSARAWLSVGAAFGLVVLFVVLTLPLVEFQNACNVGRPLLVDGWGNC